MSFGKESSVGVSKTGKRLGRPPKKAVGEVVSQFDETPKIEALPADEDKVFTFKSKFREDVITIRKPTKKDNPDGSKSFVSGVNAEFSRNTWSTTDPWKAGVLRDKIQERKNTDPLHIIETTS